MIQKKGAIRRTNSDTWISRETIWSETIFTEFALEVL